MSDWVLVDSPGAVPGPVLTDTVADLKRRELEWLLDELRETLTALKHGLDDCYALLAPIEPGSTLVVSTSRNELVKGYVTRMGTRIVKGVSPACPSPPSSSSLTNMGLFVFCFSPTDRPSSSSFAHSRTSS